MSSTLKKLVPESLRRMWWYATDAKWRQEFLAMRTRQQELKRLQVAAFRLIWDQTNGLVAGGPFQGLTYLDESEGTFPQKLLGTYEKELWSIVEQIVSNDYRLIVDVGAAEGFYVCGLARRMLNTRVIAFEAQVACHSRITKLAKANGVDSRVEVLGLCQVQDLRNSLVETSSSLLICDVEGAEFDLLDPEAVPELRTTDVLVEVHEHFRPGTREVLQERFRESHSIVVIPCVERVLGDLPDNVVLDATVAKAAMNEGRGTDMEWYWMKSKAKTKAV